MMSGLTEGRKKFADVDAQVREIHVTLTKFRHALMKLEQEDSAAFNSVMEAFKLPKETEEQKAARAEAVERAMRVATETPLRTARAAGEILEHIRVLVEIGNPNSRCDAAVGAQMAFAALKGAEYNVLANTGSLKDRAFAENCRAEALALARKGQAILQQVDTKVTGL